MKLFAVFFIIFIFSNPVLQAQSLTPQGRLKKLSRQIRGIDPTLEEYDALQVALDQHTSKVFFRKAAQVYLSSPEHVGRMVNRLDELFRLKTQSQPAELAFNDKTIPPGYSSPYVGDLGNSLDYLFKDIVENNLSWDQLLTGKKYTVFFNNTVGIAGTTLSATLLSELFPGLKLYAASPKIFKETPFNGGTLFDATTFMVVTEFSRTPNLNNAKGKDHNPLTNSIILAGKGINGGNTIGASKVYGRKQTPNSQSMHVGLPLNFQTGEIAKTREEGQYIRPEHVIRTLASLFGDPKGMQVDMSLPVIPGLLKT